MKKKNDSENKIGENYPLDFSTKPYWSQKTKIEILQRRVIVYSLQYYDMSENVVIDSYFDDISKQLVWYMENTDEQVLRETEYYYCLYDFDASTGFFIKSRLNKHDLKYLSHIAAIVIKSYRSGGSKKRKK